MKQYFPTLPEISREACAVLLGAILAAAVVGMLPGLKTWLHSQWQ